MYKCYLLIIGDCLQCYECSESQQKTCINPSQSISLPVIECDNSYACITHKTPPTGCIKVDGLKTFFYKKNSIAVLKVYNETLHTKGQIIRTCKEQNYCNSIKDNYIFCITCTTSLCNSSNSIIPSFLVIALSLWKQFLFLIT